MNVNTVETWLDKYPYPSWEDSQAAKGGYLTVSARFKGDAPDHWDTCMADLTEKVL